MQRDVVTREYDVEAGRIVSPGKFEGEPIYVPHFHQLGMEGFFDEQVYSEKDGEDLEWIFHVAPEDRSEYPELKGVKTVRVFQRSDGFVHSNFDYETC